MQIIFNGKTYNNVDEMPASDRQAYEQMFQIFKDANGNGIPDFLEGDITKNVITAFTSNVNYNGQVFNNLNELPFEAREKVQKAFEVMQRLGLATPDMLQGASAKQPPFEPAFQPSKPLLQQEPTIQESGGRNWMVILGFLGALLLCAIAIAVAIFFLR
jgi:hypothetical protein